MKAAQASSSVQTIRYISDKGNVVEEVVGGAPTNGQQDERTWWGWLTGEPKPGEELKTQKVAPPGDPKDFLAGPQQEAAAKPKPATEPPPELDAGSDVVVAPMSEQEKMRQKRLQKFGGR